jgi:hypothetical protein
MRAWILMAGLAWAQALAAAEPLPFVDPATGLVSRQLRLSMVVARLGEPPPGRGAEAGDADLQIDYPGLGLSFQAPARERPADDPVLQWMTVRAPFDRASRQAELERHRSGLPDAEARRLWTLPGLVPGALGLHVGMAEAALDAQVKPRYRVREDAGVDAHGLRVVDLVAADGSAGASLRVHVVDGQVRTLVFELGGQPWLGAWHRRFVANTAATVALALLVALLAERLALRRAAATGAATALPLGLGQWLLHAAGFTLLAAAGAGAVLAYRLSQVNAGYEQKLGLLVGLAAACSALVGPLFLMRSPLRAVSRWAQLLFAGLFIAVSLAEGLLAVRGAWLR